MCGSRRCGMRTVVEWIAAEAQGADSQADSRLFTSEDPGDHERKRLDVEAVGAIESMVAHQFPAEPVLSRAEELLAEELEESAEEKRRRRIYRSRTVEMLRRYLRYSIETGRLPSMLGQEFFRAKMTTYSFVTFEDRVIFVHDMERCVERLDEFSRQLIARRILQEHDRWATARLLHCNEKTVRRLTPVALDLLADVLVKMGLLKAIDENSCQGGFASEISVSDCDDGKNNF